MPKVVPKRVTAEIEGDFVVFLIGMRINTFWKVHKWLPVFRAMPKMIRELEQRPESGFLGHIMSFAVIVQYWRSFDDLKSYARTLQYSQPPPMGPTPHWGPETGPFQGSRPWNGGKTGLGDPQLYRSG